MSWYAWPLRRAIDFLVVQIWAKGRRLHGGVSADARGEQEGYDQGVVGAGECTETGRRGAACKGSRRCVDYSCHMDFADRFEDFQAVLRIDPTNKELNRVRTSWGRTPQVRFSHEPASHRAPVEIWDRIASHLPRYHIRTWLFVSSLHREIALRHIFHTVDIYFGDDLRENVDRGLDLFDRAKEDPVFASRVKSMRLHWAYEEGDMLDIMARESTSSSRGLCSQIP